MPLINRDPEGSPEPTDEMIRLAKKEHAHIVQILCDEPGAKSGDQVGMSFMAVTHFIPRRGDWIRLENGDSCLVDHVIFQTHRTENCIELVPAVAAVLVIRK